MFNEYDRVLIKGRNITGIIVDIRTITKKIYMVESDKLTDNTYELFDCFENEIEKIEEL